MQLASKMRTRAELMIKGEILEVLSSLRDLGDYEPANPPLKRWAIFGCPCGTKDISGKLRGSVAPPEAVCGKIRNFICFGLSNR